MTYQLSLVLSAAVCLYNLLLTGAMPLLIVDHKSDGTAQDGAYQTGKHN